jgi:beta-alanine degradation protein BauB
MKNAMRAVLSLLVLASSSGAVPASSQSSAQTGSSPQFENDVVKVWKSTVMPNAPFPPHRHDHPRVIIALAGGTMKIVEQDGSSAIHEWHSGQSYWLPANPLGTLHKDVNAGDKPIEVMVVELKKAQ